MYSKRKSWKKTTQPPKSSDAGFPVQDRICTVAFLISAAVFWLHNWLVRSGTITGTELNELCNVINKNSPHPLPSINSIWNSLFRICQSNVKGGRNLKKSMQMERWSFKRWYIGNAIPAALIKKNNHPRKYIRGFSLHCKHGVIGNDLIYSNSSKQEAKWLADYLSPYGRMGLFCWST